MKSAAGKILVRTNKDEKKTKKLGDIEIVIAGSYNDYEIENNVPYGIVEWIPENCELNIQKGDKVYGHHFLPDNEVEPGVHWMGISQVVCVVRGEKMIAINGWNLLEPVSAEQTTESGIYLSTAEGDRGDCAKVAIASDELKEVGVEEGYMVWLSKNADYRMEVEGKEYYRTRTLDILCYADL